MERTWFWHGSSHDMGWYKVTPQLFGIEVGSFIDDLTVAMLLSTVGYSKGPLFCCWRGLNAGRLHFFCCDPTETAPHGSRNKSPFLSNKSPCSCIHTQSHAKPTSAETLKCISGCVSGWVCILNLVHHVYAQQEWRWVSVATISLKQLYWCYLCDVIFYFLLMYFFIIQIWLKKLFCNHYNNFYIRRWFLYFFAYII